MCVQSSAALLAVKDGYLKVKPKDFDLRVVDLLTRADSRVTALDLNGYRIARSDELTLLQLSALSAVLQASADCFAS